MSFPPVVALVALVLWALGAMLLPSVAAAENCPNAVYRVGLSANLPDCRAYEQVTPIEPDGGKYSVAALGIGPEGEANVNLNSWVPFAGAENNEAAGSIEYLIQRTPSGWVTIPMVLSASQYNGGNPSQYVTPGLGASLDNSAFLTIARSYGWVEGRMDFLLRRQDGTVADVGPATAPGVRPEGVELSTELGEQRVEPAGYSDDMSDVLFTLAPSLSSNDRYWPFDDTVQRAGLGDESLYEYVGVNNTAPMLVGLDDEGKLISTCGTSLGNSGLFTERHNAVSGDGSTVYFVAHSTGGPGCYGPPVEELFARVDNGQADAHTVAISEPTSADCPLCDTSHEALQPVQFEGASQDGSKAFFTTTQPLLGDDASLNIYEYDFEPSAGQPKVARVSGGDATVQDPVAEVEGVVRTSEDGSHVYFAAKGVLTRTPNQQGQAAAAGANNLYVFERDAQYPAGRTAFIASLPHADSSLWGADEGRQADATPDGRFLVFVSDGDLTPDDTSSQPQVFEYDAQTSALVRISIGENGYNDNGNNPTLEAGTASIAAPDFESVSDSRSYWSGLTTSADGSYVFFQSSLALTPQAVNNSEVKAGLSDEDRPILNIYEYHDGHVYLINDPGSTGGSTRLVGTDASGADVFFESTDKLVPQDAILKKNVFDARIDGGFPAPSVPVPCSGDGCQGPLSGSPVLLSPGSEFQAGGGNLAPPPSPAEAKSKTGAKPKAKSKAKKRGRTKRATGHSKHTHGKGQR